MLSLTQEPGPERLSDGFRTLQQVAAADKQLRATRKFLEEQAAEREVERDDYTNEIKRLTEVLRVRERDKSLQERMNEEVCVCMR